MVLKCSFPGFILAPRSSVLKREKKEYDQWSYTTHLKAFWTFLDRYQNRCSLFHSSISPLSAALQLCLSEVKEFVLKSEFIENIFVFVLCVEQFVFLECLVLHTGNISSWDPSRVSRAPDEDLFTCYAGKSRLHVLLVSLWQQVVGRHFPQLRCWWQALGCTGVCRSPA